MFQTLLWRCSWRICAEQKQRLAKPRRFLEGFQHVPARLGVALPVQQFCQMKMHVGRICGIELQQRPIGLDGGLRVT